jgi:hypothetical protein
VYATYSVQGLSCPGFVVSRVCHVQGLSCPGFVLSRVCLSRVCRCIVSAAARSRLTPLAMITLNRSIAKLINKINQHCAGQPKHQFRGSLVWPNNVWSSARLSGTPCISSFGFKNPFFNITMNATSMLLRMHGTLCPYRNVHTWPAVIYAHLGTYRIERV